MALDDSLFGWQLTPQQVGLNQNKKMYEELRSIMSDISDIVGSDVEKYNELNDLERSILDKASKKKNLSREDLLVATEIAKQTKERLNLAQAIADKEAENRANMLEGNVFLDWHKSMKSLWGDVMIMSRDMKLTALIFGAAVTEKIIDLNSHIWDLQKNVGLTGDQTLDMYSNLGLASAQGILLGASFETSSEIASKLVDATGDLQYATTKTITEIAKISSYYGIAADAASELYLMQKHIGDVTLDQTAEMIKQAGLTPGKVMKDIAENTEFYAEFSRDGGRNISKAAIAAAKLGINLQAVSSISDSLLDVSTSIEGEMNASVLLGKQLNFNKARELILAGDQAAAMKNIVGQLGSMNELQNMNVIQRKAIAQAIGVSVSDLTDMVAYQSRLNEEAKQSETWYGAIFLKTSKLIGGLWDNKGLITGAVAFGANLVRILPTLGTMLSKFSSLQPLISKIGGFFSNIPTPAATLAAPPTIPPAAAQGGATAGKVWSGLGKAMPKILMGAAAIAIIAGSMWVLGKAMQEFQGIEWKTLAVAGVALLGLVGVMVGLGAIMSSGVGAVAILLGAAAIGIMAVAFYGLGKAVQALAPSLATIAGIGPALPAIGEQLTAFGASIIAMPIDGILATADAMGKLAESIGLVATNMQSLTALTTVPQFNLNTIPIEGGSTGGFGVQSSTQDITTRLDRLILLIEQGADIRLNEKQIGIWMGKMQSKINSIEN